MDVSVPQAKGYGEAGASTTRRALRSFIPQSGNPREDIDQHNSTLRQRSRLLYMAAPVAASAINTNRTKVVGTGLTLKPAVNRDVLRMSPEAAKAWERKTMAEWKLWANRRQNCDALGLNNFASLQQLALKSWLLSGDTFALLQHEDSTPLNPYGLRIHLIEADRVCTPVSYGGFVGLRQTEGKVAENQPGAGHKIYDGVEVDDRGRVLAYHICNTYPQSPELLKEVEWKRVEAVGKRTGMPNILHVMDSERPDQYRGVPYLAPVIEPLLQLRRYTEAELMAALVQSFFTAWIETETKSMEIPFNEVGAGDVAPTGDGVDSAASRDNASDSENEYEMGPGTVFHLNEGEKIVFGNPNIPTSGFEVFVKTLCRIAGAGLELPYDVLIKEFNSSYSASRGALLEAWEAFKMRRSWFVDDFCQPVYEVWLAEAVARGRIRAPGFFDDPLLRAAWCEARWIGPTQGQLDPKKEVEANILMVDHGYKTNEQVTREMGGGDWEENVEQLTRERELLPATSVAAAKPATEPEPGDGDGDGNGE